MASRYDVSFYTDLLNKTVVDCDGLRVGTLSDLSAGPIRHTDAHPSVTNLVVQPRRAKRQAPSNSVGKAIVVPWQLVASLEPRVIRLRQTAQDIGPTALPTDEVLLRQDIMDQQIVDSRGLKLRRVNDIAMALSDGTLCLWGMDTGVRALLARLGFRWGLVAFLRPLFGRLHQRVIAWECVDRLEPTRGWIRLRIPRDEVRSVDSTTFFTPTV